MRVPACSRPAFQSILAALALTASTAAVAPAQAQTPAEIREAIRDEGGPRDLRAFYAAHNFRPVWFRAGAASPASEKLVELLATADLDGLKPGRYRPRKLADAIDEAREEGSAEAVAQAELLLSESFLDYVADLRAIRRSPFVFTDPALRDEAPGPIAALDEAAAAKSPLAYVAAMGWMHPVYGALRNALADADPESDQAQLLRLNLQRARALPAGGRHILVDAAGGRLMMYEGDRLADTMRVIVGKEATPTPMMAGVIRFATLNPYWNVPVDLVRDRIAPEVVRKGTGYLVANGFEVLSDWSPAAAPTDPKLVDWAAVAAGRREVRVRQRPGPGNGMGKVKFTFPNDRDIYLHDTPDKGLFRTLDRRYSAGCVRLQDAARLGRWLFGKPLTATSRKPELQVALPKPVPVYVTYLTAFPEGPKVAYRDDAYGLDGRLAGSR